MAPVKVGIPALQDIITVALQEAKLLGSDEVYLRLSPNQAKAIKQSLVKSSGAYRDMNNNYVPSVRFINLEPEKAT